MKRIFIVFLLLLLLFSCNQNKSKTSGDIAKDNSLKEIIDKKVISIGVDDSELPWIYYDRDKDSYIGFEYILATMIGKELGVEIQIKSADWAILGTELLKGKFDILLNAYSDEDVDNPDLFEWSSGYHEYGYVIVVRADNTEINSVDDLQGKKVITYIDAAELVAEEIPDIIHEITEDPELAYEKVSSGDVDAFVYDSVSVNYVLKENSDLKVVGQPLNKSIYRIAAKKGKKALIDAINKALTKILKSTEYKSQCAEWI